MFATIADAIHNRDDSFRMKTAPQSELHVLGIKKVPGGKMFDAFETLDWNKAPPALRLPKDVIEKTSAKYREAFQRLTNRKPEMK